MAAGGLSQTSAPLAGPPERGQAWAAASDPPLPQAEEEHKIDLRVKPALETLGELWATAHEGVTSAWG